MICTRFRREGKAKALPWSLCQSRLIAMTETIQYCLGKTQPPGRGLGPEPKSARQGPPIQQPQPRYAHTALQAQSSDPGMQLNNLNGTVMSCQAASLAVHCGS